MKSRTELRCRHCGRFLGRAVLMPGSWANVLCPKCGHHHRIIGDIDYEVLKDFAKRLMNQNGRDPEKLRQAYKALMLLASDEIHTEEVILHPEV